MAVYLSSTSDYLSRNSSLLPLSGDFTVMFWTLNNSVIVTTPTTGWAKIDAYPLSSDGVQLSTGTHPGSFYRAEYTGGFFAEVEEWSTYLDGDWNHHAIVYNSSTGIATMYVNGSAVSNTTFSLSPLSTALEVLGNNGNSTVADHHFAYFRSWNAVLTATQIQTERLSRTVVRTSGLWMNTPLATNANDISGNGRNWSANGSVSYDAIDPLPPPPTSFLDITSTPYSRVVTVAEFNAGTYSSAVNSVWFRFIADATTVFAVSTTDPFSAPAQVPKTTIYAADTTTVLESWTGSKAGGYRVTEATVYWVKIERNGTSGAADQDFTVTASVLGYITSVPDDAIIINDDASGFPALAMTVDGTYLGYISTIPAGEIGAILPNGISLWHNRFAGSNKLRLLDTDFSIISDFDLITPLGATFPRFANNDIDFWVSDGLATSAIYKVTDAAVVTLETTLDNTGYVIGINSAGTILYYIIAGNSNIIYNWDIVNDVSLGVFHTIAALAGVPSYRVAKTPNGHPGDILVLSNGSLVTWYRNITASQDTIIVINSAGTLVNSFNLSSTTYEIDHISYSPNDPDAIRVWIHISPNYSTAIIGEFSLVTGSFTTSFNTDLYSELINSNSTQLFGPSNSCTMVSMLSSEPPPAGTATLIITKITNPSPDATDTNFDFTTTGTLSPDTFDLKNGETQTYSNLAAGTYGVTETPEAGWATIYAVNNGDPHDAIELEDGDTVIVTVTNTRGTGASGSGGPNSANSGLYKIVPEKRDDTLWESYSPKRIKLTKIPDPFITTGLLGE